MGTQSLPLGTQPLPLGTHSLPWVLTHSPGYSPTQVLTWETHILLGTHTMSTDPLDIPTSWVLTPTSEGQGTRDTHPAPMDRLKLLKLLSSGGEYHPLRINTSLGTHPRVLNHSLWVLNHSLWVLTQSLGTHSLPWVLTHPGTHLGNSHPSGYSPHEH